MSDAGPHVTEALPIVLVPGLCGTPLLFGEQIPALWRFGPIVLADQTRHDTMPAIASDILNVAPPRFALVGMSGGGYIALEIMRHAPERVERLALLNTSARPDTAEQTETRRATIEIARMNDFSASCDRWPRTRARTHSYASRLRSSLARTLVPILARSHARRSSSPARPIPSSRPTSRRSLLTEYAVRAS